MTDLSDPLSAYSALRATHQQHVHDFFEELVRTSQVDEEQNARTVNELRSLERQIRNVRTSLVILWAVRIVVTAAAIPVAIWGANSGGAYLVLLALAVASPALAYKLTDPELHRLKGSHSGLEERRAATEAEALAQMAPLNALHTWGTAAALFQQSLPEVQFDRYLSEQTLLWLHSEYGLNTNFLAGRSMLALQSGTFRDNPFVFARYRHHWIGTHTYSGSLVIHWSEQVRNSDGQWETVARSQTLTASVVKPHPFYAEQTVLMYGHEAVPSLSFSRTPSRLSGLSEGNLTDWRIDQAVKLVERKARRVISTSTSGLTVMANTKFEALFRAIDRNSEVDFRVLFTPLAQQNMVKLLTDGTIGYGDDFAYARSGKLSFIEPTHLAKTDYNPSPQIFASLSVADARQFFREFHVEYFRSLYFSFAPLWTAPILTDALPPRFAPADVRNDTSSTWEHEVMANYIGEGAFRHPASTTSNILKAVSTHNPDGTSLVTVDASGYKGVGRVEVVTVRGGDGKPHSVPVNWTDYVPVVRRSTMLVGSVEDAQRQAQWQASLRSRGMAAGTSRQRGWLAGAHLG